MDNVTLQKIRDLLVKHQNIGIVVGPNPTLDAMAGALGLYLTLEQMGKQVIVASPTPAIVEISSLVGIDKVKQNLGSEDGDLVVSFPYEEGEIEKVSYTLEGNFLNIVVKAGEKGLSFQKQDVTFKRDGKVPSLLFVLGVQQLTDLGALYKQDAWKDTEVINIDNKENNQKFGNIVVVDQKFSSISEQVADFLTLLEPQITISIDAAQNLLSGILFATNDFQDSHTSYLALEMAGILMRKGAQRKLHSGMGDAKTQKQDTSMFFPPKPQQSQGHLENQNQPIKASNPTPQPMDVSQSQPQNQQSNGQVKKVQTPPDWLAPKVYKGSTVL